MASPRNVRMEADTTDFFCKLQSMADIPENAILITIGVIGLYSHTLQGEGLQSMKETIEEIHGNFVLEEDGLNVEDIIDLAKLILESNYLEFGDSIFRRKMGTAIGTKFAPAFANMLISSLERRILGENHLDPWVWWRFLDDTFLIWCYGEEKLMEFLN